MPRTEEVSCSPPLKTLKPTTSIDDHVPATRSPSHVKPKNMEDATLRSVSRTSTVGSQETILKRPVPDRPVP
jgi:hypothetical protein